MSMEDPKRPPAPKRRMVLRKIQESSALPPARPPPGRVGHDSQPGVAVAHPTIHPPPSPRPFASEPLEVASVSPPVVMAAPVLTSAPSVRPVPRSSVAPVVATVPPPPFADSGSLHSMRGAPSRRNQLLVVAVGGALLLGIAGFVVGVRFAGAPATAAVTVSAAAAPATTTSTSTTSTGAPAQTPWSVSGAVPSTTVGALPKAIPVAARGTAPKTAAVAAAAPTGTPYSLRVDAPPSTTSVAAAAAPTTPSPAASDTAAPDDTTTSMVPVIPSSTPAPSDPLVDAVKQDIAEEQARKH